MRGRNLSSIVCCLCLAFVAILVTAQPSPANQEWDKGVRFYNLGKYSEAISHFSQAHSSGYQPASCFYYQALCYQRLGMAEKAKFYYKHILTYYPSSEAAVNASLALSQLGSDGDVAVVSTKQKLSPVELIYVPDKGGHMIVPVEVNGRTMSMIFDTGAGATFFAAEQLKSALVRTVGGQKVRMRGVGGEVAGKRIPLTLKVGSIVRKVYAYVQEESYSQTKWSTPLLGQDFFKDLEYTIDEHKGVIRFYPPADMRAEGTTSVDKSDARIPFTWDGQHIVVIVKVNDRECKMTLDTGSTDVAFSDRHLATYGLTRPTSAAEGRSAGVGGTRQAFMFNVDRMSMGPVSRQKVPASCSVHMQMKRPLLGMSFLRGITYTVDPNSMEIRIKHVVN